MNKYLFTQDNLFNWAFSRKTPPLNFRKHSKFLPCLLEMYGFSSNFGMPLWNFNDFYSLISSTGLRFFFSSRRRHTR